MKVRTAVGITAGIITAQVTVAWFAAKAWLPIPDRWPPTRWHIELGNLSEALAAFAAAGAAFIALWIAACDRRDRNLERRAKEETVARLVRLDVEPINGRPVVIVKVRNFGPLPILDVAANGATWTTHPDARLPIAGLGRGTVGHQLSVLRPWQSDLKHEETVEFEIQFLHPTKDETLIPRKDDKVPGGTVTLYQRVDPTTVTAKFRFTTADGIRWETTTAGAGTGTPKRV
ncbi:MAG: hypothetical protein JO259_06095 [Mycobacterium sp.]|nr:hypothetical protein [Mycobacterium sp.]